MILSSIAAVAENNAIGLRNGLPWYLPEDLKFFKKTTLGKPVIMGRKTFESIQKPLPGRLNIVLSGKPDFHAPPGVLVYSDINDAIAFLQKDNVEEAFIIGGAKVYESSMSLIDCMYITRVHAEITEADAFFPNIDHTHWKLVWEEPHPADDQHKYAYTFQKFERVEM